MAETQIRVVNELGEDVAHDGKEVGEIIVKGRGVMHDTEGGWSHTGDMGTIDENGQIQVIDRKKDILSDGEGVSSFEIEKVITGHPAVQEVSIIPTPHEKWGEIAHAFVVLHDGHDITEQELINFTTNKVNSSKCPKAVTFLKELPKTASGKILKTQLKETV
ncbi:AMP-binding enzyme [Virgibacillus tibetensis]